MAGFSVELMVSNLQESVYKLSGAIHQKTGNGLVRITQMVGIDDAEDYSCPSGVDAERVHIFVRLTGK